MSRTSNTRDGFLAGQIGDMNEGVIEGGEDVGNAEHVFALCDLGAERDVFFLRCLDFFGGLSTSTSQFSHPTVVNRFKKRKTRMGRTKKARRCLER